MVMGVIWRTLCVNKGDLFVLSLVELGGVGWSWVELGGVGWSWVELGGVGWSWVELGGVGWSWVELGGVCEMCMCLARAAWVERVVEWMRGLGLGFTNPVGTGEVLDVCLCFGGWCMWGVGKVLGPGF